ncbi:hypothetical protein ABIC83_002878 [Roseateles asaccharophilus]|uniref:hypothetical protein n=1 Tax=Roseateles asaccharophilus TaxID=582607 RepID=UPI003838252C
MATKQSAPCVGDYITGRCVTMGSMHVGQVVRVAGRHGHESAVRYCIKCEDDGRERVVFHQGFAFRPADHCQDARVNAAAWAAADALSVPN